MLFSNFAADWLSCVILGITYTNWYICRAEAVGIERASMHGEYLNQQIIRRRTMTEGKAGPHSGKREQMLLDNWFVCNIKLSIWLIMINWIKQKCPFLSHTECWRKGVLCRELMTKGGCVSCCTFSEPSAYCFLRENSYPNMFLMDCFSFFNGSFVT